jgi:hypothetical protein
MWNLSRFDYPEDLRQYLVDNNIKPESCHITYNGHQFLLFWYVNQQWTETKTLEKLAEPKFKVGDRIKQIGCPRCYIIKTIEFDRYILNNNQFIRFRDEHIYELVPNKFDITTLKPFDKVLVRDNNEQLWTVDFFGFYGKTLYPFACVGHYTNQCVPYEQNKHLLGTTDVCDDYFITW